MENRAGVYIKQLSGEAEYKSFVPTPLQRVVLGDFNDEFYNLLSEASRKIGILDNLSSKIPNVDLFIGMYIRKEALLSSQIEGTQATLDDILDPEAEENKNLNVAEVINYIKATTFAMERLNEIPLCNRLLKETHAVLLSGLRGNDKNPGEFRHSQNWIGAAGSTLKTARYIPPAPLDMEEAMSDLEKYFHEGNSSLNDLIKIALIHYQFETIHPFLDGNGRIGRLLIALYLHEKAILTAPVLYISYYLKLNRVEYYDRLMEVRKKNDYEQWVAFFVRAMKETADNAIDTIEALVALREKDEVLIKTLGRARSRAEKVYNYLLKSPIIDLQKTSHELGIGYNTVARAIDDLSLLGIVEKSENAKRNRLFSYTKYLEILRKDT